MNRPAADLALSILATLDYAPDEENHEARTLLRIRHSCNAVLRDCYSGRRSFFLGHATPGATCTECDPHARADADCESTEPQPAAYRVHLDPSDYEGNNLGPDEAGEHDLCLECLEHLAPWIAHELRAADNAAAGYSNARDDSRPREPDEAAHFRCEG